MSERERDANQGDTGPSPMPDAGATLQQKRRRLLKAATMAPAIYTLPVGAATAASSVNCHVDDQFEVTRNDEGDVNLGGETFELTTDEDGQSVLTDGDSVYVYEGDEEGGTLTTRSCWNSLNRTV